MVYEKLQKSEFGSRLETLSRTLLEGKPKKKKSYLRLEFSILRVGRLVDKLEMRENSFKINLIFLPPTHMKNCAQKKFLILSISTIFYVFL